MTSICDERGQELIYAGMPITEVFKSEIGLGGTLGLLWFQRRYGCQDWKSCVLLWTEFTLFSFTVKVKKCVCVYDRLPRYACHFIEMCLMVTADHGPAVSGAHNTIVCARAGKDLISSLTSGLLTIVRPVTLMSLLQFLLSVLMLNMYCVCVFRVTGSVGLWMLLLSSSARLLTVACCPWSLSTRWRKMANWSWALDTESNLWVNTVREIPVTPAVQQHGINSTVFFPFRSIILTWGCRSWRILSSSTFLLPSSLIMHWMWKKSPPPRYNASICLSLPFRILLRLLSVLIISVFLSLPETQPHPERRWLYWRGVRGSAQNMWRLYTVSIRAAHVYSELSSDGSDPSCLMLNSRSPVTATRQMSLWRSGHWTGSSS